MRRPVPLMVNVVTFSEAGGHPINEDAFRVERHSADAGCWLCCLADGQGGRAGGARAAAVACRAAMGAALRERPTRLAAPSTWVDLLARADAAARDDAEAGLTTLVGFGLVGGFVAGASCGDSAVLVAAAGQSPREVTANQRKNPPVGSGAAAFMPFGMGLAAPWTVLAMSDGVWKYAGWDGIRDAMSATRGRALVGRLADAARLRGSGQFADDFTVVACDGTD